MNIRKIFLGVLLFCVGFIGTIAIMMNSTSFLKSPTPVHREQSIEEKNSTVETFRKYIKEIMEPVFSLEEIVNFQSLVLALDDARENVIKEQRRCIEDRFSGVQKILHRYLPTVCGSPIYNWFYPYSEQEEAIKNCTSNEYNFAQSEFLRLKKEAIEGEDALFGSKKWQDYVATIEQKEN